MRKVLYGRRRCHGDPDMRHVSHLRIDRLPQQSSDGGGDNTDPRMAECFSIYSHYILPELNFQLLACVQGCSTSLPV